MTIDMTRHSGACGLAVAEQIDRRGIWRVRTDIQPEYESEINGIDSEGNVTHHQRGVTFIEHEFPYKPSMAEVKEFVLAVINARTDEKILTGFEWEGISVWLSEENQRNFSEAQRIAATMPDAILPVTFKLGEYQDGQPVYHEFKTAEELTRFYLSAVAFINETLASGWKEKDAFDWTPYEETLL